MKDKSFEELLAETKSGAFIPGIWNWVVTDNVVKRDGEWQPRTHIYVMGEGAEQCFASFVCKSAGRHTEAAELVERAFGVKPKIW